MTSFFSWILKRFMIAFAILFATQILIYILGLNLVLSRYEKAQVAQYCEIAAEILSGSVSEAEVELPGTNPFFVFSIDKELLFSNRGKGRSIVTADITPVYSGGNIAGYFHAGELGFADNQTNRIFLVSLIFLTSLSVVISLVIGFFAAWLSSRKMSEPVGVLRHDIHDIRSLKTVPVREFDISEFADMSVDTSETAEVLLRQEDYKRQWLRDLSHDLRTPLAGLKSQLEAMIDGVLEPTGERFERHLSEVKRLESLAESIGELTAIESRNTIDKTNIDIDTFVSQLTTPYEIEAESRGISIEKVITAGNLYGDQPLLLRAVGNILSNAVKFVDNGGRVRISAAPGIVEIANNGPEIPAEQRELIFTRLYRGDSGRTTPGSGLGLSITREIINLHGGEVRVEPLTQNGEPVRGVKFVINLNDENSIINSQ